MTVCTMQWSEEVSPGNPAVKPPQWLEILLESNLSLAESKLELGLWPPERVENETNLI